jgi:hypothetical protein
MRPSKTRSLPAGLEGVRRRFEHWRRTHRARSRIPDWAWAAAVRAAGTCGIHRTSKALRLNYYSLKDRVEQHSAAASTPPERSAGATFLELAPLADHGSAAVPVGRGECTLELEDAGGAKMRISLKGVQPPDLAALCRSFWK